MPPDLVCTLGQSNCLMCDENISIKFESYPVKEKNKMSMLARSIFFNKKGGRERERERERERKQGKSIGVMLVSMMIQ